MKCSNCSRPLVMAGYRTKEYRDVNNRVYKTRRSPTYRHCPCRSIEGCSACLGFGRLRDSTTGYLRRCLDCHGSGQVPRRAAISTPSPPARSSSSKKRRT